MALSRLGPLLSGVNTSNIRLRVSFRGRERIRRTVHVIRRCSSSSSSMSGRSLSGRRTTTAGRRAVIIGSSTTTKGRTLGPLFGTVISKGLRPTMRMAGGTVTRKMRPRRVVGGCVVGTVNRIKRHFRSKGTFIPRLLVTKHTVGKTLRLLGPLLRKDTSAAVNGMIVKAIGNSLRSVNGGLITSVLRNYNFRMVGVNVSMSYSGFIRRIGGGGTSVLYVDTLLAAAVACVRRIVGTLRTTNVHRRMGMVVNNTPMDRKFTSRVNTSKCDSGTGATMTMTGRLVKLRRWARCSSWSSA